MSPQNIRQQYVFSYFICDGQFHSPNIQVELKFWAGVSQANEGIPITTPADDVADALLLPLIFQPS